MSCEKTQTAVATQAAGVNGVTKGASKSAFVAGSEVALTPGQAKNDSFTQNGAGRGQVKNGTGPQTRLERIKKLQQRAKDRQVQKELLVKSKRALTAKNVKSFHQAIKKQKKVVVRYRSAGHDRTATVVPLDVKRGQTEKTRDRNYMWCYFEKQDLSLPLKLDDVVEVKQADESFDLKSLGKTSRWWKAKLKNKDWNLPRDWSKAGKEY